MNLYHSRIALATGALLMLSLALAIPVVAAGKQSFTGEVGDAMCGKKHMDGSPAECTRACVEHGSKYALVVGDKVYILETEDKDVLTTLDKQAGKNVTVTGTTNGDSIEVSSVVASR